MTMNRLCHIAVDAVLFFVLFLYDALQVCIFHSCAHYTWLHIYIYIYNKLGFNFFDIMNWDLIKYYSISEIALTKSFD